MHASQSGKTVSSNPMILFLFYQTGNGIYGELCNLGFSVRFISKTLNFAVVRCHGGV